MSKKIFFTLGLLSSFAFGHTALMSCFDNGDGSVTCEGGFSDGSSASGTNFRVEQGGNTIIEGRFDEDSEFTFDKPDGGYIAIFDAGEGHQVKVDSKNIVE
ncbi:MAG: hypothetical protein GX118_07090 [Arcobacter butzleri]|jgi:hypothetical protein|nr:hypothetical protein [Arcobacteraceae bacterium]MDY0364544.1 hypothetical protein [Arcobacteraceae bacterium]NLO17939.1 hypothetical protein [Aliarcobacter butzleri]